ncbi:MAG: hypothetical protein IJH91_03115 [Mogibacterium sp.]|nr:hypothetical protein [Mogibacterium sp.]
MEQKVKMNRLWKIVTILLLGMLLVSCGSPSPSDQVMKDIEDFKKISFDDLLSEMGNGEGEALFRGIVSNDRYAKAIFDKVMDFDYEINSETISEDGNYAEVTVTIKTYPFGETNAKSMAEIAVQAFFGGIDFEEAVVDNFLNLREKSFSRTVVIHCTKTNRGWQTDLRSNEDFVDGILGGSITGVKVLEDFVEDAADDVWGSDDYSDADASADADTAGVPDGNGALTLEDYLVANPEVVWKLEETLFGEEYYGEVAIDGNKIILLVDFSAMYGSDDELDDETLPMVQEVVDAAFDDSEMEIGEQLGAIEAATGFSGVSMDVMIIQGETLIYERSFSAF